QLHQMADALALEGSVQVRDEAITLLRRLGRAHTEFAIGEGTALLHATRAERLVLALDRLNHTLRPELRKNLDESLAAMFALVQSRPDFNPKEFARLLEKFALRADDSAP
ncbi:MAG: hypothetical protein ACXW32_12845, partial [Limisphaerales bacterium]